MVIVMLLYVCTCRWEQHPTIGTPPLAMEGYASSNIGQNIYYFGGYCGHGKCYHNSLNMLNVKDFSWKEIFPTTAEFGPMKKSGAAMLSFDNLLLTVGGRGCSHPKNPTPSATYEKHSTSSVYTNEHLFYDTEGG